MQPDGSIYSGNSIIWQQGPILTISFLRNQLEIYHLIYCTLVYSLKKFTNQQQVNFHVNIILHATNSTQLTPVSKIIKMFNASATDVFTQRHFLTSASIISSRIKHIPATRSDRWAAGFTCQVCYFTRRLVESRNTILFSIYLNLVITLKYVTQCSSSVRIHWFSSSSVRVDDESSGYSNGRDDTALGNYEEQF